MVLLPSRDCCPNEYGSRDADVIVLVYVQMQVKKR
jgi:hypothetical protein